MRSIRILSFSCRLLLLAVGLAVAFAPAECGAITLGQVDDFQDGTTQNWGIGGGLVLLEPVDNVADAGPLGVGDRAMYMDTAEHGGGRLLINNWTQWLGNWTAAGVTQISLDVRNPTASSLSLRLGIAGPGGVGGFGSGDTYVSSLISVPADDAWHSITFDVLATNFTALGGTNVTAALAGVTHMRFLNNAAENFLGSFGGAFYLDNILALGAIAGVDGDYNGDGIVNAADYTVWRDSNGQNGPDLAADGNGDSTVDSEDYDYWKARFGNESGSGAAAAIPEPASILLGAMLMLMVGLWRWFDLRVTAGRR